MSKSRILAEGREWVKHAEGMSWICKWREYDG